MPVVCSGAGTLIARYDEHALVSRFKFGVLHQRAGQVTEEQLFGNRQITPAFQEFLDLLGQKIDLKDHKGLVTFVTRYLIKNIFKNSNNRSKVSGHLFIFNMMYVIYTIMDQPNCNDFIFYNHYSPF